MWSLLEPRELVLLFLFAFGFGLLKSAFGIAGAMVTPAFSLLIEPRLAVTLLGPMALWTDMAALRSHWGKWVKTHVWRMAPAMLVGTLAGTFVLRGISTGALNKTLAAVTLLYASTQIWQQARRSTGDKEVAATAESRYERWLGSFWSAQITSLVGGVIGALSHSGGQIMTFYLLAVGLRKESYIATLVSLFFMQNLLKVPLYLWMGLLSGDGFWLTVATIPLVFLGGWLGKRVLARLSPSQFSKILNLVMLGTGLLLLFK